MTVTPVFRALPPVALCSLALTSNCFAGMVDAADDVVVKKPQRE
jgi:hypothetical protein